MPGNEPDFCVLYGFRTADGHASAQYRAVGEGFHHECLQSLLSKQLQHCSGHPDAGSGAASPRALLSSDDSDSDSLCCDNCEDIIYAEELCVEGFASAQPIPICVDRSTTRRHRELLQRLEQVAQNEDMKRAAERYNCRMASTMPASARTAAR